MRGVPEENLAGGFAGEGWSEGGGVKMDSTSRAGGVNEDAGDGPDAICEFGALVWGYLGGGGWEGGGGFGVGGCQGLVGGAG